MNILRSITKISPSILALFLLLNLGLPLTCYAQQTLTAKSAAAMAKKQYGGKVVNVSQAEENGQVIFKVKLLLDGGRVKTVTMR